MTQHATPADALRDAIQTRLEFGHNLECRFNQLILASGLREVPDASVCNCGHTVLAAALPIALAQEQAVKALRSILPLAEHGAKVMAQNPGSHQEFIREDADDIAAARVALSALQTPPAKET